MHRVLSQLDTQGKAELSDLATRVASGGKRRGRIAHEQEYLAQNPWHDRPKDKPVYSLGTPLPHNTPSGTQEADPWHERVHEQPNFSLGEPLPRTVRRLDPGATGKRQEEDVEKGLRKRPKKDAQDTPDTEGSDETLSESRKDQSKTPQLGDDEQGTDMAQKFRIDADTIGGQREGDAVEEGRIDPNAMRNDWARIRAKYPEPLAEFLCTAMSVFLGLTGTLSVNLSQDQSQQYGSYETACWAWGLSFMFGIYLGGGVSGAHMNPVISISLSIFRGFPWRRCGVYVVVQILAAFAGGALAYAIYSDAIAYVDPTMTETYSSFFTVPKPWVSMATAFFSEFLSGAVIMIAVLSLGDDQNNPPGAGMHAFILGLLVTVLKMTLGYNTGAALSPASDLGPRLVAYAAGYQFEDLWKNGWWFYGPWCGTMSGAVMGCSLYDAVVFVGSESPVNYRWSQEKHIWRTILRKEK